MMPLNRLDREAVKIVYFRADSTDTLGAIEVSWDDGETWTTLEAATDDDDQAAYRLTVRGPNADSTAGKLLPIGFTYGMTRIKDTPEIEVHRFRIEVK